MRSLAAELSQKRGINLYIATTYEGQSLFRHQENSMYFFLLPQSRKQYKYDRSLEPHWKKLLEETMPQVYTAEQMAFLQSNGLTLDVFTQYVTMIQVVCCGAAMPLAGVVLGALGGYTAPDAPA